VPAVALVDLPHAGSGILLAEPSVDGPPHVVVVRDEDSLRPPRVSIEVRPASQDGVRQAQPAIKSLATGRPAKEVLDLAAQLLRALLRDHHPRHEAAVVRPLAHTDVVTE